MKLTVNIARILTGLLFIFSGVIKLNDPSGFSIKLNEYFDVFAQDVSTKQDTLKISLSQGTTTLGSQSFVLYSFDKSRDLEVSTEVFPEKDTTGKILRYEANLTVNLGGQSVSEYGFSLPDSATVSMFSVAATVAGKPAFQKTYPVSVKKPAVEVKTLNLKEYVKSESALNSFFKWMKNWSLFLSIFICALEVILGFALIVGWNIRLTAWLLLLLIVFFTFLTFYAAYFNKVTDCGCFGDFIKLKPWQSFNKDLILLVLILIIFFGKRYIKPWFSRTFGWKFMGIISLLSFGFGVFCYLYLPVWDFLPYKKGNDIHAIMTEVPAGMRSTDSIQMIWVMERGNDSVRITTEKFKEYTDKGWKYRSRIDEIIIEGYKSPIHDFAINDAETGMDLKDSFLQYKGYQVLFIFPLTDGAFSGAFMKGKDIWKWASEKNIPFFPLSATSSEPANEFAAENKLGFSFFSADQKMLLTMARYNPTLYLFNGSVVVDKWSGRNLPSIKKLEKLIKR